MSTPPAIRAQILVLVTASTLLQALALLDELSIAANTLGRHIFSSLEMALVAGLLWQSRQMWRWSQRHARAVITPSVAKWCFLSLAFCGLGDLINRNYFELYYQYDQVIKYSYLITSISCFFPGYFLIIFVNWRLTANTVSLSLRMFTIIGALICGGIAFATNFNAQVHPLSSLAIAAYSLLLSVLAGSSLWLIKIYGWQASAMVVIGIFLAPIADAVIANFWIYSDHFPTIEHVNWIIYYASLAMIQQLPSLVESQQS